MPLAPKLEHVHPLKKVTISTPNPAWALPDRIGQKKENHKPPFSPSEVPHRQTGKHMHKMHIWTHVDSCMYGASN